MNTAISEATRKDMSTAAAADATLSISDLEKSMAENGDDEMVVDWAEVLEELLPLIKEALESEEAEIRRNALLALRKSVSVGDMQAMPLIRKAAQDEDWMR